MCAAEGRDVALRRHPVQPDRAWVAEHEVKHPPAVDVEPVVGQLLTADLVVHQPRPVRTWADVLGPGLDVTRARAILMPLDVVGLGDDGLAAGIPSGVDGPVAAVVVVVVDRRSYLEQGRCGPLVGWQRRRGPRWVART